MQQKFEPWQISRNKGLIDKVELLWKTIIEKDQQIDNLGENIKVIEKEVRSKESKGINTIHSIANVSETTNDCEH